MRRVFITGSSDGLGLLAGTLLIDQGHKVVLHARNATRARGLHAKVPGCDAVVVGDVSTVAAMRSVADQVNARGPFDAVIHNVALGTDQKRSLTDDDVTQLFAVNVVAPYVLTALITPPERLVYLSSDMHAAGDETLQDLQWQTRRWNPSQAYADTKLHDLILALYLARCWPELQVNAVHPGWVPTRMGGRGAPDDLLEGATTQAWLAVSDDPSATVSGRYFHHRRPKPCNAAASLESVQERLIGYLVQVTGIRLPG